MDCISIVIINYKKLPHYLKKIPPPPPPSCKKLALIKHNTKSAIIVTCEITINNFTCEIIIFISSGNTILYIIKALTWFTRSDIYFRTLRSITHAGVGQHFDCIISKKLQSCDFHFSAIAAIHINLLYHTICTLVWHLVSTYNPMSRLRYHFIPRDSDTNWWRQSSCIQILWGLAGNCGILK